ncbi:MAG: hypothetical protein WBF52_07260 [Geitlerinemataceae cyanobacterium]
MYTSLSIQDTEQSSQISFVLALLFFPFTALVLSLESAQIREVYGEMRWLLDLLTMGYCCLAFFHAQPKLKRLMAIIIPLSFLGEVIFSEWLELYTYRTDFIPIYVPFGHAIVYSAGYIFADRSWVLRNKSFITYSSILFYSIIFLTAGLFFGDLFTLIFGALFFAILYRKKWDNLYFLIAFGVVWVELVGTHFGCWTWSEFSFNTIATANPPLGAVFFYAGGDVLVSKIDRFLGGLSDRSLEHREPLH